MTAVEAVLVSLYGFRPDTDFQAEKQLRHETFTPSSSPLEIDASQLENEKNGERDNNLSNHHDSVLQGVSKHGDTALSTASTKAPLKRQTSNCSSSSSIADDWILNQIPVESDSNVCEEMAQSCTKTTEMGLVTMSPERQVDNAGSLTETSPKQILAEDWSRGTALTDPLSREPLQPVKIHQPSELFDSDKDESQFPSTKKIFNVVTEKRAALTAYDLISNRALRAPLSPAAQFEKQARAEVLMEKPTASLQDISIAVHEKWKNLREEDRKK